MLNVFYPIFINNGQIHLKKIVVMGMQGLIVWNVSVICVIFVKRYGPVQKLMVQMKDLIFLIYSIVAQIKFHLTIGVCRLG